MGDTHHVCACVTNNDNVSRDVKAPTMIEAIIGCETVWTVASEDRIVVVERVLRVQWEVGKAISLKAEWKPFAQVKIFWPDSYGRVIYTPDDRKEYGPRPAARYRVQKASNVAT